MSKKTITTEIEVICLVVFLPVDTLKRLNSYKAETPYLFKFTNPRLGASTYGGVIEFTSDRGCCNMPKVMMEQLGIIDGDTVELVYQSIYQGNYIKIQPHSTSFIELDDPKLILEERLKNYVVLKKGESITIRHLKTEYMLSIVDCMPADIIRIIDVANLELDFMEPKDYKAKEVNKEVKIPNPVPSKVVNSTFSGKSFTIGSDTTPSKPKSHSENKDDCFNPKQHRLSHGIVY